MCNQSNVMNIMWHKTELEQNWHDNNVYLLFKYRFVAW